MATTTKILWGSIDATGKIASGSKGANGQHDFSVTNVENGVYVIGFSHSFSGLPAMVGSQNRFGSAGQNPLDNVTFPMVSNSSGTAVTGDAGGNKGNRAFGFIAIGDEG